MAGLFAQTGKIALGANLRYEAGCCRATATRYPDKRSLIFTCFQLASEAEFNDR